MRKTIYTFVLVTLFTVLGNSASPVVAGNNPNPKNVTCSAPGEHTGLLDQYQCDFDGGLSARTSYENKFWQSFTAGKTGTLTEIDLGFFGNIDGFGKLEVFSGEGTGGQLLATKIVAVYCPGDGCLVSFSVSAPVTSGQRYTFQFTPGFGIPDPYGVQIGSHKDYLKGVLAYVVLGTTNFTKYDAVFSTFVN